MVTSLYASRYKNLLITQISIKFSPKCFLPCSVPYLEFNLLPINSNHSSTKFHSNCEVMHRLESFVSELEQKTWFAHTYKKSNYYFHILMCFWKYRCFNSIIWIKSCLYFYYKLNRQLHLRSNSIIWLTNIDQAKAVEGAFLMFLEQRTLYKTKLSGNKKVLDIAYWKTKISTNIFLFT